MLFFHKPWEPVVQTVINMQLIVSPVLFCWCVQENNETFYVILLIRGMTYPSCLSNLLMAGRIHLWFIFGHLTLRELLLRSNLVEIVAVLSAKNTDMYLVMRHPPLPLYYHINISKLSISLSLWPSKAFIRMTDIIFHLTSFYQNTL